jgi:hypothetical protein
MYIEFLFGLLIAILGYISNLIVTYIFNRKNLMIEKYVVYMSGDVNDGDYVYSRQTVSSDKLTIIRKMAQAIKNNSRSYNYHVDDEIQPLLDEYEKNGVIPKEYENFVYSSVVTFEELLIFHSIVPCGSQGEPVHSLDEITIIPVSACEELL